jgi:hypothetical protein
MEEMGLTVEQIFSAPQSNQKSPGFNQGRRQSAIFKDALPVQLL